MWRAPSVTRGAWVPSRVEQKVLVTEKQRDV